MNRALQTYTLPAFWAPALINGDSSGMDDNEIERLDMWLAAEGLTNAPCVDCSDEPYFVYQHDAWRFVLASDALDFTFSIGL